MPGDDQRRQWEITEKEKEEQLRRETEERERLQVQYEMLSTAHERALQTQEDKMLEISRLKNQLSEKEKEARLTTPIKDTLECQSNYSVGFTAFFPSCVLVSGSICAGSASSSRGLISGSRSTRRPSRH